ncbi:MULTISPECIES: Uma2 family endonuclease [unclassified Nocardia]|uniref:Uma2 family endonuclease n=1 Tax=unclassified Nocardia TaxID=2637762 RepID=UPI001CE458CA|nr:MULTISPECIES: Uma2 family endonuclease [unclassified Nocardia]
MTTLELPPMFEWTPDALERLPSDYRYEVREGNLVVMASAMRPWHARTQSRVCRLLEDQQREAYAEQGIVLCDGEIRTCDVGVFRAPPIGERAYRSADEFEMLVEIVSRSSRREDREIKPKLYAAAGIAEYWRIEEDTSGEPIVYQYHLARLDDGTAVYVETRVVALTTLETGVS